MPDAYGHSKSRTKPGSHFKTNRDSQNDSINSGKLTVDLAHSRSRFRPISQGNFDNRMSNVIVKKPSVNNLVEEPKNAIHRRGSMAAKSMSVI